MPHLDARLVPPRGLGLLRDVSLFSPLTPSMLEQVAHRLEAVSAHAGDVLVAEGGVSDRFYVIESGEVEVTRQGRVLRAEGAGEVFGEIGLLRDLPRTATVTATTDVELLTLSREEFLALLAGEHRIRGLAHELATRRLEM
jgi:CRP-like cAMP-binding protein